MNHCHHHHYHHHHLQHVRGRAGDILEGLDVHRVGGLALEHLIEGHEEELVFGELPKARDDGAVRVLALQHRHYVELLAAPAPVTKPEKERRLD